MKGEVRFADPKDSGIPCGKSRPAKAPVSVPFPRHQSNIRHSAFERRAQFRGLDLALQTPPRWSVWNLLNYTRDARGCRVPPRQRRGWRGGLKSLIRLGEAFALRPSRASGNSPAGRGGGKGEGNQSCAHKRRGCGTYNDV